MNLASALQPSPWASRSDVQDRHPAASAGRQIFIIARAFALLYLSSRRRRIAEQTQDRMTAFQAELRAAARSQCVFHVIRGRLAMADQAFSADTRFRQTRRPYGRR